MQNTRLTVITTTSITRLGRAFTNPWRRTSLYIISPLFGFFLASIITSVSGAKSIYDPVVAAIVLLLCELISRVVYRENTGRPNQDKNELKRRSLFLESLNLFKIGVVYGMFLEAFKLGS
jgi:hypothetical protein